MEILIGTACIPRLQVNCVSVVIARYQRRYPSIERPVCRTYSTFTIECDGGVVALREETSGDRLRYSGIMNQLLSYASHSVTVVSLPLLLGR